MFKRRVAFILAVLTIMSVAGFYAVATAATPTLTVDGITVKASVRSKSGEALFPIRLICEALGSKGYKYSYKSGKATITAPDDVYKVTKGSRTYYYDNGGDSIRLDIAPALYSSMLYVPESFMTDMMGMSYSKDSAGNHILKTTLSASAPTATGSIPGTAPPAALGNIYLNEKQLTGTAYANASGYLMVPLQPLVQAHNGTMSTTGTTSIIMVNGAMTYVDPSQTVYSYNGQQGYMLTRPELSNGILYVHISFVETVFGATYTFQNGILRLTSSAGIASAEYPIRLNGQLQTIRGYTNIAGKTMLPVKLIGEALGFTVSSTSGVVYCAKGTGTNAKSISFTPGQTTYMTSAWGGAKTYPASEIRANEVFVPVEFLATEMGLTSAELTNGEIVINTTGGASGSIPIKFYQANGIYQTASVYGKASANGSDVLIPINELASRFGYENYRVEGNTIILQRLSNAPVSVYTIRMTLGSTQFQIDDGPNKGFQIAYDGGAPEMSGLTLYVPMEMIAKATGCTYSGNLTSGVEISPPASN